MEDIRFSWDARKASQNLKKHKVSFDEAATVFYDEKAIQYFDPDHSKAEDRFLLLGLSWRLRVLVVCYCIKKSDYEIRIISARKATKKETKVYTGAAK
ncbi:MAG: BrnT family toxin [Sedimentisphaerales bacterium]|nr:BrnT family toxin [Sedimentisphaerales bacterium]